MLDYTALKSFGCACYLNLRPYNTHKLNFHTTKCVFLGYSSQHKGYKCLSSTRRLYISRHVIFNEDYFPFQQGFINKEKSENSVSHLPVLPIADFKVHSQQENMQSQGNNNVDVIAESSGNASESYNRVISNQSMSLHDGNTDENKNYMPITNTDQIEVVPNLLDNTLVNDNSYVPL